MIRRSATSAGRKVPIATSGCVALLALPPGPNDGIHDVAANHGMYLADAYADRTKEV